MKQMVKVLIAEDSPTDAELVKREVKKTIPNSLFREVDTKNDFIEALKEFQPDIVLSDYNMPSFTGIDALRLTLKISPITPLIIVTGSINEETAVNCIKAGAADYIIKEYIKRIGQAIISALEKKEINLKKIEAEKSLRESEENYRRIFENIQDVYYEANIAGKITAVSPSIKLLSKGLYSPEDVVGKSMYDFYFIKKERQVLIEKLKKHGFVTDYEISLRNRNNAIIPCSISARMINSENGEETKIIGSMRDISARKKAENQLLLLQKAIEQSPVIVMITDPKGNIEYVNSALNSVTGYTFNEVKGKNVGIFRSEKQGEKVFSSLWNTILAGEDWRGELLNKKKDGEHYWEEAVISPILNDNDEITHFIAIKEDVSEKKLLIQELINAKEKAEESDRLKSAFLANMSHEIRTPMNGILGFVELLKQPKLSGEEQKSYVEIIEQSGERMLNTLNDLIDISRIEAGQVKLFYDEFKIDDLIQELYEFFQPEAENKGLRLNVCKIDKKLDGIFYTDKEKLYAILANLLKNAIKYTTEGEINIGCEAKDDGVLFRVSDTGIGIEPDRIEAIFDRFVQADNTKTKPFEGSGLGLSIARAYADMLGGNIWVESTPGKGSSFYVFVKRQESVESFDNYKTKGNILEGIGKGKSILLAEDEYLSFKYMETLLKNEKFNVIHAENGKEAIQMYLENPQVDLILMDFKMPEMGGYEATMKIREFDQQIPIIAQTAYAIAGDKEKAFNVGCSDYLTKPVKRNVLINSIQSFLK